MDTVREIVSLQKMKATQQGIELKTVFENIGFGPQENSPMIFHDENRIK